MEDAIQALYEKLYSHLPAGSDISVVNYGKSSDGFSGYMHRADIKIIANYANKKQIDISVNIKETKKTTIHI